MSNLVTLRTGTIHASQYKQPSHSLCGHDFTMSDFTVPALAGGSVNCGNCLRAIAKLHVAALEVNAAIIEGATAAEKQLDEYGENCFNSTMSDSELANVFELQHGWLKADINTALGYMNDRVRRNLVARVRLVVLYGAEIAFRRQLHDADKTRAQKLAADSEARVQRLQEAARTFIEGVQNAESFTVALPPRESSMPTENNYGEESGPFVFIDHPHDRIRAERYDDLCTTLLAMAAQVGQPTPSSKDLVAAVVGLEFGEAIEEDRARFPHESFTRFDAPLPAGHRLADGTVETVHMIGSDLSRRHYPQNMVLIARADGIPQVVTESSLFQNLSSI